MNELMLVQFEKLFLALSDKTRLRLLALMADGEVPVGFLAEKLGESQPKISRHLAYLRSAGLVSTRREGKWVYYGLESHDNDAVTGVLTATLGSILQRDVDDRARPVFDESGSRSGSYDPYNEPAPGTYVDDWAPAELEIYLL